MLPSSSLECGIKLLECAPCAVDEWLLQRQRSRVKAPDVKKTSSWNLLVADAVLDVALSTIIFSGATKVLLPFRLMEYMENSFSRFSPSPSSSSSMPRDGWLDSSDPDIPLSSFSGSALAVGVQKKWCALTLLGKSNAAILLPSYQNLSRFLELNKCSSSLSPGLFHQVVIPVPSCFISSKMLFPEIPSENFFYQTVLPEICEKMAMAASSKNSVRGQQYSGQSRITSSPCCFHHDRRYLDSRQSGRGIGEEKGEKEKPYGVSWIAWMRSALSCRFEGAFPSPIRLGDNTAAILTQDARMLSSYSDGSEGRIGDDGKCAGVIWEEGIGNSLSPRWMETILKSAVACGVPLSSVMLSFCRNSPTTPLAWMKAVEGSVSQFACCSLSLPLFPHTDPRITLPSLQNLIAGFNESSGIQKEINDSEVMSSMNAEYARGQFKTSWKVNAAQMERTREWCAALRETWSEFTRTVDGGES